ARRGRGQPLAARDLRRWRMGAARSRPARRRDRTPMEKPVVTRVSHACSPEAIDDELAKLWRDAGRDGPVARALMANLVVFREKHPREQVDLAAQADDMPVDEVARRHPSRVILLCHGA